MVSTKVGKLANMRVPPVVLMLVDGLGYDFVSPGTTPWLASRSREYPLRPMRPVLGYSDCQRAVLFTGERPDRMGYWMLYRFARPAESPWRWLGTLSALDDLPADLPRKALKFGLSASVLKLASRWSRQGDLGIHNMPFRALPWLRPTLKDSMYSPGGLGATPTIFDRLRAAELPFGIIRSDVFGTWDLLKPADQLLPRLLGRINGLPGDLAFLYVYLHTPDMYAHRYGIKGAQFQAELARADGAIAAMVEAIRDRLGPDAQIVIVSDHGMDHTERSISFQHLVRHRGLGKDFVVALDSTMVRVMYLRPSARGAVRDLIESSGAGRFLTPEERRHLGVDFPPEHYGEDIYLLGPGASIYPNFHSLMRPLAMHAYHPDVQDQRAIALFLGDRVAESVHARHVLDMPDIFPVLSSVLGLGAPVLSG